MKSILQGNLLIKQSNRYNSANHYDRLDPKNQQESRESLLHALSAWPSNVSLELHLTALPDLCNRSQGVILVTLFIKAVAPKKEIVIEEIIQRYISIMPILAAHFPEIEFVPVTTTLELSQRRLPFRPAHAIVIYRIKKNLSLSTAFKNSTVGFGPATDKSEGRQECLHHCFPWLPSNNHDSRLFNTMLGQLDPVQIVIRIKVSEADPITFMELEENIRKCELFLSPGLEYQVTLNKQASLIRDISLLQMDRLLKNCFDIGVFILGPSPVDKSLGNILGQSITALQSSGDKAQLFQGGFLIKDVALKYATNNLFFPEKNVSLNEAASAFRLPTPPLEDFNSLPVKRSRTSAALISRPSGPSSQYIELFLNEHQGLVQPVRIGTEDRMRHMAIFGQTGTGKSYLMKHMIIQDIHANRGVCVIDPHGDMVDSILEKIPENRVKDVILFDIAGDKQWPFGFNLLEWETIEERDLIIDELYLEIDRMYDLNSTGGPVFENNFRGILKLLMGDKHKTDFTPTLLEFITCYMSKDFRKYLQKSITDPQVKDFVDELENTGGDASLNNLSPYITSKFSRFVYDTTLKRVVGQEKTSFDFDNIINSGKIFLVKLGRGRWGSVVSSLLANQLVTRFKNAVMKRGDLQPRSRREFYMYIDECQTLPADNFTELLSESRKFRMGLILATQYTKQLSGSNSSRENNLLNSILGNVGTILTFRLGMEDADMLGPALYPNFNNQDIIGLPNYHGYAKMQLNNEPTPPFSFITTKDQTPNDGLLISKIRSLSRLKYGTDAAQVDRRILERRSLWIKN